MRRALERPGFRERCFTEAERAYCESRADPAQSYAARFAGKEAVGKALGCGVRFTWKEVEIVGRPKPGVSLSGRTAAFAERVSAGAIDLSMTHSRELAAAICVVAPRELDVYEPLYTAEEMRARRGAVSRVSRTRVPELMERAGTAVAREAMLAFPAARRFACVCGGGSNGGDGRVAARVLREAGHEADETAEVEGYDVVVDALFGTGFAGEPRAEAAALIERINAAGAPVVSVDLPSGVDASTGEIAGAVVDADLTVTFHAPKVGLAVAPGSLSRRAGGGRGHRPRRGSNRAPPRERGASRSRPAAGRGRHEVHGRLGARRRRAAGHDRRSVPLRARGLPRGRGLRHARGSVRVRARRRVAGSGGGQDRLDGRGRSRDDRGSRRAGGGDRPRPGAGARLRASSTRPRRSSRRSTFLRGGRRCALRARAVRTSRADRAHAARR